MTNRVYVITVGDYEDYTILGVFSNKVIAEHYCNDHNKKRKLKPNHYGYMRIEEYILDGLIGGDVSQEIRCPYCGRIFSIVGPQSAIEDPAGSVVRWPEPAHDATDDD